MAQTTKIFHRHFVRLVGKEGVSVSELTKTAFSDMTQNFIKEQGISKVVVELTKSIAIDRVTIIAAKEIASKFDVVRDNIGVNGKILITLSQEPTSSQLEKMLMIDECRGDNYYKQRIERQ